MWGKQAILKKLYSLQPTSLVFRKLKISILLLLEMSFDIATTKVRFVAGCIKLLLEFSIKWAAVNVKRIQQHITEYENRLASNRLKEIFHMVYRLFRTGKFLLNI